MTTLYLIPGLGGDQRMYQAQLARFPNAIVLEHLAAVPGETLAQYANRFRSRIDSARPFSLIGTSLGGMVAMELSRAMEPEKVILISSIKSRVEMPPLLRLLKFVSPKYLKLGNLYKQMCKKGADQLALKGNPAIASRIHSMMDATPTEFMDWAAHAVGSWDPPKTIAPNVFHIHGTRDLVFPAWRIHNPILIPKGTHIMVSVLSDEVNEALSRILEQP